MSSKKRILGIDPGTNVMGYGIIDYDGKNPQLVVMGALKLSKFENHYMRLNRIYERVSGLISQYSPSELAIEAPFFGKNVQSMLKLGRAQGVAIAACMQAGLKVYEYSPLKIKMALTGNGGASKEQVADLVRRLLCISKDELPKKLDATDAVAAAYCHFLQRV